MKSIKQQAKKRKFNDDRVFKQQTREISILVILFIIIIFGVKIKLLNWNRLNKLEHVS